MKLVLDVAAVVQGAGEHALGGGQSLRNLIRAGVHASGAAGALDAAQALDALVDGQALAQRAEGVGSTVAAAVNADVPNGHVRLIDGEGDVLGADIGGGVVVVVEVVLQQHVLDAHAGRQNDDGLVDIAHAGSVQASLGHGVGHGGGEAVGGVGGAGDGIHSQGLAVDDLLGQGLDGNAAEEMLVFDNLSICMSDARVTIDGHPISLTKKELEILYTLCESSGKLFSREMLLSLLWGYDYYGDSRTVDSHVKRLRVKLDTYDHPRWQIKTVWGMGYKFEVIGDE